MSDGLSGGGSGQTPVHPDDLVGLLDPSIRTTAELNAIEVENVQAGLVWARSRPKALPQLLDDGFLRALHRHMFGEVWSWAGTYRTRAPSIGIEASHVAASCRTLMQDAITWAGSDIEPKAWLAMLHHRLAHIHPFPNGNGRIARSMVVLVADAIGEPTPTWGRNTDDARDHYLAALRSADAGDHTALTTFMWS